MTHAPDDQYPTKLRARSLLSYGVLAEDSTLGTVVDLHFDDEYFEVRHLAIESLANPDSPVLLLPGDISRVRPRERMLDVSLTFHGLKESPRAELRLPVSRQRTDQIMHQRQQPVFRRRDHLRSLKEVVGYRVVATDGPVGSLEDVFVDPRDWTVTGLILRAREAGIDEPLCIPPEAVESFGVREQTAALGWDRLAIERLSSDGAAG